MEFKAPKVEFITISRNQVVFASGCNVGESKCDDGYTYGITTCEGSTPGYGCTTAATVSADS